MSTRFIVRSFVFSSIVLFSSVSFSADPTPAETLAAQAKENQKALLDAHANLIVAKQGYSPYKDGIEKAESQVKAKQESVLWYARRLQPYANSATANTDLAIAAGLLGAAPTDLILRERVAKAQANVDAAEAAIDEAIILAKQQDADFRKLCERLVDPEVALQQLEAKAQRALAIAQAELAKLRANAATAKAALDAAQKAADEAAQKLAPLVTATELGGLKDEVAGVRTEIGELRKEVAAGFKALAAKNPMLVNKITTSVFLHEDAKKIASGSGALEKGAAANPASKGLSDREKRLEEYVDRASKVARAAWLRGEKVYTLNQCCQLVPVN